MLLCDGGLCHAPQPLTSMRPPLKPRCVSRGFYFAVERKTSGSLAILMAGGAGAREAADLVQSGIATRVAVFSDPQEVHEFIRRGLPDRAARQIRQLKSLGVTDVVQIPTTEVGTNAEARALLPWCDQHQFQSIVLVTTRDHSRRSRRVLNRVMKGHPTHVMVQPARYSWFDPDRWWKTRGGVWIEIIQLQKLALDAALHPLSF